MSKYGSLNDELSLLIAEYFPNLQQQLAGCSKRKRVSILNKFCHMNLDHNCDPEIAITKYLDYLTALAKPVVEATVQQIPSAFKGEIKFTCMGCYKAYPRSQMVKIPNKRSGIQLACKDCYQRRHVSQQQ